MNQATDGAQAETPAANATETATRPAAAQTLLFEQEPAALPVPQAAAPAPRVQVMRHEPEQPATRLQSAASILSHSDSLTNLFTAFARAQGSFATVERTLKARIDSRRTGNSFEFSYESLADVLELVRQPLSENGLAIWQFPSRRDNVLLLRTMISHASGEWLANDITVVLEGTDARAVGSGITYIRRYTIKSILGLAAGETDDDGEMASEPRRSTAPAPRATQRRSETPAAPLATGVIRSAIEPDEAPGALVITLDTGFKCGTSNAELVSAVCAHEKAAHRVDLMTRPSSNPSRFMPILEEITVSKEEPRAEN